MNRGVLATSDIIRQLVPDETVTRVIPCWQAELGSILEIAPRLRTITSSSADGVSEFIQSSSQRLENSHLSKIVRAKITALGTYVPPRLLTNADLEKMVETSDEWIRDRTGIRERHIVSDGMATSDLAVEAAKKALAARGIEASDLDAIIVSTVTPDMFFPSTAC